MTKRHVSLPPLAEEGLQQFIRDVDERLSSDEEDICDVVEDVLIDLFGDREAYERWQSGGEISPAERVRLQGYDPCNATLESEYYAEVEAMEEQFERSKYLQWLWRQFEATPMADNIAFALRFRRMLAKHLFDECGDNCRFFKGITFTYGHNIAVGDNVVIHDDVHLDDRGKLTVGDRVSISDDAHIYSHRHDATDQTHINNYHTIIQDDARVTYDAMVQAGVEVGENAILAAKSAASKDIPAHHIAAGSPAESIGVKEGWASVADPVEDANVERRDQRRIPHEVPDNMEVFDEFNRDRSPPDA